MCNERQEEAFKTNMCDKNECVPYEQTIQVVELARAYVPFQKLCSIYSPEEGLINGTIFPELNKPYSPDKKECKRCKPVLKF